MVNAAYYNSNNLTSNCTGVNEQRDNKPIDKN